MKRGIALGMALLLLLALTACGKKQGEADAKIGRVDDLFDQNSVSKHFSEAHEQTLPAEDNIIFSSLSAALLALEKGEVDVLDVNKATGEYIVAHNDRFQFYESKTAAEQSNKSHHFSMMTNAANTELHAILDGAIKQLKADGTLDRLIAEDLNAFIATDPTPAALPTFEGAKTYKIAVTGDLPPLDYVTADGKAAGFNVALLTEIAGIAQVNFELVPVDSGARLTALSSGKVDAVFWTIGYNCLACGERIIATPEGTLCTESYFSDYLASVVLKRAK